MDTSKMNKYESVIILTPKLTKEEVDKSQKDFIKLITDLGGTPYLNEIWGKKRLAYPITDIDGNKQREGWYLDTEMWLSPDKIDELVTYLEDTADIIKHIIVKKDSSELEDLETPSKCEQEELSDAPEKPQVNAFDVLLGLASYEYINKEEEEK